MHAEGVTFPFTHLQSVTTSASRKGIAAAADELDRGNFLMEKAWRAQYGKRSHFDAGRDRLFRAFPYRYKKFLSPATPVEARISARDVSPAGDAFLRCLPKAETAFCCYKILVNFRDETLPNRTGFLHGKHRRRHAGDGKSMNLFVPRRASIIGCSRPDRRPVESVISEYCMH